jgi:type VII secretion protein EccB
VQTRREQVRAYRFVNRRMVSALLSGDPESQDLPMRRLGMAIFGSAMVAVITFAVVAVYGVYSPGGGTLTDNSLVIERETGATYVYREGTLYPVANFASARLVLGEPTPKQQTVSQATLRGRPRGPMIGISGAPATLPPPAALVGLPWSVCGAPTINGGSATQLMVGQQINGGTQLGERSMLVSVSSDRYLIWHHHRLQVRDNTMLAALQLSPSRAVPVSSVVLNAITAGPTLQPPAIDSSGASSGRVIDGRTATIGSVYRSGAQYYVLLTDGFAFINEVTKSLLTATTAAPPPEIPASQIGAQLSQRKVEPDGWLTALPDLVDTPPASTVLCATYRGGDDAKAQVTVEFFRQVPDGLPTSIPGGPTQGGVRAADRVVVQGGHGALVRTLPVPGAGSAGTTVYLVTDEGIKYGLAPGDVNTQAVLGYDGVTPALVPADLLALVPTGPVLDATAAHNQLIRLSP